ncbi:MAG: hypothetical protein CVT92_06270 [Bacteroidetes bacterium HGW-Bacteroidetes-1]|jgi:hypothetical protein|nr:MAG: hypothetical protein CVT92_06270 [Bacteroidetes bacterium HGW-Bacteroidetes-1]
MNLQIKLLALFFLGTLLVAITSCNKEKESWEWCNECQSDFISGSYEGIASHTRYVDSSNFIETKNKDAYVNIMDNGSTMTVQSGVINLFALTVSGQFQQTYYIEMGNNSMRFSATIWRKDNEVKLVGSAQKFNSNVELTEILEFEVFKTE